MLRKVSGSLPGERHHLSKGRERLLLPIHCVACVPLKAPNQYPAAWLLQQLLSVHIKSLHSRRVHFAHRYEPRLQQQQLPVAGINPSRIRLEMPTWLTLCLHCCNAFSSGTESSFFWWTHPWECNIPRKCKGQPRGLLIAVFFFFLCFLERHWNKRKFMLTDRTVLWSILGCGDLWMCHLQKERELWRAVKKNPNKPKR